MTTNTSNSFNYIDGVGAINMSDGVVRMDMLSITGFENDKPVVGRSGGLAISMIGFVRMHEQMAKVVEDMVQKGLLQKRDQQAAIEAPAKK
jgi:hypothetical protein